MRNFMICLCLLCSICEPVRAANHPADSETGEKTKPSILWGYKGGFFVKTDDERFKLKIGGWAQMMWTGMITDGDFSTWVKKDDTCTLKQDMRDAELTQNEFQLRRARMVINATTFRHLHTKVVLEFLQEIPALYYFATYQPIPELGVRVGQFKTPLSRHYLLIPWRRTFVSGALAMTQFNLGADHGVTLLGSFRNHLIEYEVGAFNGSRIYNPQDNTSFLLIGRLAVNPLGPVPMIESDLEGTPRPLLSLGLSAGYNPIDYETTDYKQCTTESAHAEEVTLGADVTFIFRGLVATAELYYRGRLREAQDRLDALGFLVQTGYFVWPRRIELAARTSMVRPDMAKSSSDRWEVSGVANWFIYDTQLELQLEWSFRQDIKPLAEDKRSHWARLQLLFRF